CMIRVNTFNNNLTSCLPCGKMVPDNGKSVWTHGGRYMANCKWCEQPFLPVKDWQVFCCERHCQDWHLHQRKLPRQEKLFAKLRGRDEALAKLSKGNYLDLLRIQRHAGAAATS